MAKKQTEEQKSQHALLSPSSASRWLACTPSARLEENEPDTSGEAAREGTLAHDLSELYLRNHLKMIPKAVYNTEIKKLKANELYNQEMEGHAMDYVADVVNLIEENNIEDVFIEKRLDLTEYVPESFGRGDFGGIGNKTIFIRDLKYGRGEVSAEDNPQMMLYALGTYLEFELTHDIELVNMQIYQPRIGNYSIHEITVEELLDWADSIVKKNAQKAFNGEGDRVAGNHCTYCSVKHTCRALQEYAMSEDIHNYEDPDKLNDEDIVKILEKMPVLISWLDSVKEYAQNEAMNGKEWEGMKLVRGRGSRYYSDPEKVEAILKRKKIKREVYMTKPELKKITAMTKALGSDKIEKWFGDLVEKKDGKPTLVAAWDKRKAINSPAEAKKAFGDIDINQFDS